MEKQTNNSERSLLPSNIEAAATAGHAVYSPEMGNDEWQGLVKELARQIDHAAMGDSDIVAGALAGQAVILNALFQRLCKKAIQYDSMTYLEMALKCQRLSMGTFLNLKNLPDTPSPLSPHAAG